MSTRFVYEHLKADQLRPDQHPDIDGMLEAIRRGDLYGIAGCLGNALETVTIPAYPVIGQIKEQMMERGSIGCLMSGSGPTVFGLFSSPRAAADAYEAFRYGPGRELARQVYLTSFYTPRKQEEA